MTDLSPGGENPPGDFCARFRLPLNRAGKGLNLRRTGPSVATNFSEWEG